jgi:restriction system protein
MQQSRPGGGYEELRGQQMLELEVLLLDPSPRMVNVHGAPGSGKTSLTADFYGRHRDRFPGGRLLITGSPSFEPNMAVQGLSDQNRSLLVLDEVDRVSLPALTKALSLVRTMAPMVGVLATSSTPVSMGRDTHFVAMPPLTAPQVVELLAHESGASPQQLAQLARMLAGNATAAEEASRRLASGMPAERIVEWLETGPLASAWDPAGDALQGDSPQRARLDLAVAEVSEALIVKLAQEPELLYELDPRKFELLVAELYRRQGFEATLTPAAGDEGVDIYVVSRSDLGQALWVVQAKRYAARNPIGAGIVRELYGTVMAKDASAGILVTTSFFQPGAKKLEREFEYRLSLKNYLDLQELLRRPKSP